MGGIGQRLFHLHLPNCYINRQDGKMDRALPRAMEIQTGVSFNAAQSNSTDLMELRVDIISTWLKAYSTSEKTGLLFSKPTTLESITDLPAQNIDTQMTTKTSCLRNLTTSLSSLECRKKKKKTVAVYYALNPPLTLKYMTHCLIVAAVLLWSGQ